MKSRLKTSKKKYARIKRSWKGINHVLQNWSDSLKKIIKIWNKNLKNNMIQPKKT